MIQFMGGILGMKERIKEEFIKKELKKELLNDLKGFLILVAAMTIYFLILKEGEPFAFDEKFVYVCVVGGLAVSVFSSWFDKGANERRRTRIYSEEWERRNKQRELFSDLLTKLKEGNMCSHAGDELINNYFRGKQK